MKKLFLLLLISGFSKCCFSQDGDFYNLYFAGNALLSKGQFDQAITKYGEALKLFKADYVYFNLGNAYVGKKDYSSALDDYTKTLELNKGYAEAYCQRGLVKIALSDNTACDDLKKAAKLDLEEAKTIFKKNCK